MAPSENNKCNKKTLSDAAIVMRKMRKLKLLTRKQAGIIFNLSHKTIEKLENGRGIIDQPRLVAFAGGYGFTFEDLLKIKVGQFDSNLTQKVRLKKEKEIRKNRRFYKTKITKECQSSSSTERGKRNFSE